MLHTYTYPKYEYRQSDEQRSGERVRHPVMVIGAGPVGMTQALDCAARGIPTVVLDDNNTVSIGSRAVCYAKRPLEIWDRLGLGDDLVAQGVQWKVGKVFFRDELVYQFDLLPEDHHKMPAMINLQQYYLEERLVRACDESPLVDLRWKHKVLAIETHDDHVVLTIETPDGIFKTEASWLIACDGASSDTRRMIGADFTGQFFQDRFLIADVVMKADFPTERWFWFDPPFHRNQSVLLHKQCDNVWRIDFQLGWDADPNEEKKPEKVIPRIQAMLGPDVPFELEWVSVYQFACRRIDRFRHGRVIFAGDAAHQVSPFGARGANSGVQDCDNLSWKLKAVLDGDAPEALLDTYHDERAFAADDNLLNSTRSTDFITPKSRTSLRLRNAVLELARTEPFARPLVNSGRLSTPTPYVHSPLNTPDAETAEPFAGRMTPGTNCADAPVEVNGQPGWLLNQLGRGFVLLSFGPAEPVRLGGVEAQVLQVGRDLIDRAGVLTQRYDGQPGTVYLIRPDQYVAARWRRFDRAAAEAALARALGHALA
ncbi:Anhydrotetracycline monooxygenase [Tepidimonas fonticaldi]|uniref:Anhydrotetracycline monooxygenase n=1 Tax=Tepidimonas fonticaldi TaxID=1101373 RepID=A0A554XP93_9BURK|nr:FAD-dependent oxidoreductase [Tepidimonas fonticaldi]TSE37651.1 Anhydrotetracycline monooxygenase [Tepidimonas fonticaldi]